MNTQFLKKYQPLFFKDFTIDKEYIELLNTLNKMDSLNILLVGNNGSGKTSILYATIREYYNMKEIPIKFHQRKKGKSKIPKIEIFRTILNLFIIKFKD